MIKHSLRLSISMKKKTLNAHLKEICRRNLKKNNIIPREICVFTWGFCLLLISANLPKCVVETGLSEKLWGWLWFLATWWSGWRVPREDHVVTCQVFGTVDPTYFNCKSSSQEVQQERTVSRCFGWGAPSTESQLSHWRPCWHGFCLSWHPNKAAHCYIFQNVERHTEE